ncbi:MAG: LamG domain-containing protein [Akkermansiaceae bacterium]
MKPIQLFIAGALAGLSTLCSAFPQVSQLSNRDYSFGYWENGVRKHKGDDSRDILSLETGYFGLQLDMAQLDMAQFGLIDDELDYEGALATNGSRMQELQSVDLKIELEKEGKVYTAVSSLASKERAEGKKFQGTMLWESARYVQNYEIQGVEFKSADGESLVADSTLQVIAWPSSISFTASVTPTEDFKDGPAAGLVGQGLCIVDEQKMIKHEAGLENEEFTVESWIKVPKALENRGRGWIISKTKNETHDGNYGLILSGGKVRAMMNIGGKGAENRHFIDSRSKSIVADTWHHVALTYDGKTFSLFLDGNLQGSKVIGKKRNLATGDMTLGKRADGHGGVTPVLLDQLRVWDRALTRNELLQHTRKPGELKNRDGLTYENHFESKTPIEHTVWKDAKLSVRFGDRKHSKYGEKLVSGEWKVGEKHKVTVNCDLGGKMNPATKVSVVMKLTDVPPVTYDKEFNCYVARIAQPKREWKRGEGDLRNYDEVDITVESDGVSSVPFLLELFKPAGITGLCPILCDENGVPTGIPVQLSKNWHYPKMGSYLRSSMLLPTVKGVQKYKLRIVYGFYGTVPSASHSQLSLVGYGGNGRWDQLAIGSWGETYCMDMDMSLVDVAVTDIRMLMTRDGKDGKKWQWTDAGWGGDWLGLNNAAGDKLLFKGMKAAYVSHGPCLTEVKYKGFYGSQSEVDIDSTVRTLRTNDHARTFSTMKYRFDKVVKADGWLFKMGRSHHLMTPEISYGNKAGLIKEYKASDDLKAGATFVPKTTLMGAGPWWVAFPNAELGGDKKWGTGYRAMVIRSYKVTAGGKEYRQPVVEFPVYKKHESGVNIDFLLTAPEGVTEFQPGDEVELEVEWITLPNEADDYYGSNEVFRDHVAKNPGSWKTTHREAVGNDLKVVVGGGRLIHQYPIIIEAEKDEVVVEIVGGVGYVPIRFEGLETAEGYTIYQVVDGKEVKLDQAVHGNDFWQTDYDVKSKTFKMTFNLPLDGMEESKWVLKKSKSTK